MVVEGMDGFYNELRRKYPHTFTLVTDLGKEVSPLQRLPVLEVKDGILHDRKPLLPRTQDMPLPTWTANGFFSKVQVQKCAADLIRCRATPAITGSNAILVPSWNVVQGTAGHRSPSIQLPTLRSQIEQNQEVLRTRLHFQKAASNGPCRSGRNSGSPWQRSDSIQCVEPKTLSHHRSVRDRIHSPSNTSEEQKQVYVTRPDPLSTIMKDLLPNRPGKLLPKDRRELHNRNGSCTADADCQPLVYMGSPAKIFRIQTVEVTESVTIHSDSITSTTSAKDGIKPERRVPTSRVRFEDESLSDAEGRYQERALLRLREEGRDSVEGYSVSEGHSQPQEINTKEVSVQSSPLWSRGIAHELEDKSSKHQALPIAVAKQGWMGMDSGSTVQPHGRELVALEGICFSFPSCSQNASQSFMASEQQNHRDQRALSKADKPRDGHLSFAAILNNTERNVERQPLRVQAPQSSRTNRNGQISVEPASADCPWSGSALKQTQHPSLELSCFTQESACHSSASQSLSSNPAFDGDHLWPMLGRPETKKHCTVKEISYLYSKVKKTLKAHVRKNPPEGPGSGTGQSGGIGQMGATSEQQNLAQLTDSARMNKATHSQEKCASSSKNHHIAPALFPESSLLNGSTDFSEERGGKERKGTPCSVSGRQGRFPRSLVIRAFVKKGRARNYLLRSPTPPLQQHRDNCRNTSAASFRTRLPRPTP
ncbi:uncharacterized protein LOC115098214 isoform X2 [Rhinatrema bivittatum]|uniref:uncharacterized protein LOC115098214 isoform X2 n=1 Tax=Rhinatrema bivittatum TaxID=194408 RepID=UPI00112A9C2E|nr:uncharacterized protein LOC115098214 isoform X2 [Rhinatrema bivittatum]